MKQVIPTNGSWALKIIYKTNVIHPKPHPWSSYRNLRGCSCRLLLLCDALVRWRLLWCNAQCGFCRGGSCFSLSVRAYYFPYMIKCTSHERARVRTNVLPKFKSYTWLSYHITILYRWRNLLCMQFLALLLIELKLFIHHLSSIYVLFILCKPFYYVFFKRLFRFQITDFMSGVCMLNLFCEILKYFLDNYALL